MNIQSAKDIPTDNSLPSWWNTARSDITPVCWLVISRKVKDPMQSEYAINKASSSVKINNGLSTQVVVTKNGEDFHFESISKALKMLDIRMTIYKYRYAKTLHDNGLCEIDPNVTIRRVNWSLK